MHHVLVVDDDSLVSDLIARMLFAAGYRVDTASNGSDALDLIGVLSPDLILSDMQMPVMDGGELHRALRARGLDMPFIGMSGNRDLLLTAGFDACLTKPFKMADLLSAVKGVLEKHLVS